MKSVLVTGALGQLGQCIRKIANNYPNLNFLFKSSAELDITQVSEISNLFAESKVDYCINCAAYTNVEKAEEQSDLAYAINADAVKSLAEICEENNTVLIHISTDYVFDGEANSPLDENYKTNPINVYGASKLKGEEYIANALSEYFIIRTSWLYSEFGHNFLNTILKKAEEKATLNITDSQLGTPTNANDLAQFILELVNEENKEFGLYHFSNLGEATWHDFAAAILEFSGNKEQVVLNKSNSYKTMAARPNYSILDKSKLKSILKKDVPNWRDSLEELITSIKK